MASDGLMSDRLFIPHKFVCLFICGFITHFGVDLSLCSMILWQVFIINMSVC